MEENPKFKISIVGPTRVGKTSLIASILKDSQRLLEGTPVSIAPYGSTTERRLAQHHKELEGSLRAGEFNPGAVSGTEEMFTFELLLDPGDGGSAISFSLLDYPGGWLDPNRRPADRDGDWKECKQWMKDSTVLMIPVESAVIMEADKKEYKKAVPFILCTSDLVDAARAWAKARANRPDEPALVLLCPVKCESYMSDNGGCRRDRSQELFRSVCDHYLDMLNAIRGEASHAKICYIPVDTIGCVEIIHADWQVNKRSPGGLDFMADYRVRAPEKQRVKGADDVLVKLCGHLVSEHTRSQSEAAEEQDSRASSAQKLADRKEGFFTDWYQYLIGVTKKRQDSAKMEQQKAKQGRRIVESLEHTLERIAARPLGARVKDM